MPISRRQLAGRIQFADCQTGAGTRDGNRAIAEHQLHALATTCAIDATGKCDRAAS